MNPQEDLKWNIPSILIESLGLIIAVISAVYFLASDQLSSLIFSAVSIVIFGSILLIELKKGKKK